MKKKLLTISTILFALFLIAMTIFNLYTLNSYYKYKKQLINYIGSINKINSIIAENANGQAFDLRKLSNALASISQLEIEATNFNADQKYSSTFLNLSKGIHYNKLFVSQLISILKNPSSSDVNTSLNNLAIYSAYCNHYYSSIKSTNKSFSLPSNTAALITRTKNYINYIYINNKNKEITSVEKSQFNINIQKLLDKFLLFKCNLYYYVQNARKNKMSYSDVIAKTNYIKDKLTALTNELSTLSVPNDCINIFNSFNKVLDDYNAYISSFLDAVTYEASNASNCDYSNLYKASNSNLNTMDKDLNKFKDNFNSFSNDK